MFSAEDLEQLRQDYQPESIRLLFLGESPPPRGPRFFYLGNSALFDATQPVFVDECGFPADADSFLIRFAETGCYLEDVSKVPGDKPSAWPEGDERAKVAIARIARLLDDHEPVAVVTVIRSACPIAEAAVASSTSTTTVCRHLPFPHPRNLAGTARYQRELGHVLREFGYTAPPADDRS